PEPPSALAGNENRRRQASHVPRNHPLPTHVAGIAPVEGRDDGQSALRKRYGSAQAVVRVDQREAVPANAATNLRRRSQVVGLARAPRDLEHFDIDTACQETSDLLANDGSE